MAGPRPRPSTSDGSQLSAGSVHAGILRCGQPALACRHGAAAHRARGAVGHSWRWSLAVWGVPLVVIAILIIAIAPRPKAGAAVAPAGRSWWPDWSNKLIWQIGFLFGSVNSMYFCSNAFLPGYLREAGRV